ncbi:hypothetical protein PLESTM_001507500 [Pleodorina starrii]|nr:hypothetical protein PLESTM_001507500 [Pleodorina starrii]
MLCCQFAPVCACLPEHDPPPQTPGPPTPPAQTSPPPPAPPPPPSPSAAAAPPAANRPRAHYGSRKEASPPAALLSANLSIGGSGQPTTTSGTFPQQQQRRRPRFLGVRFVGFVNNGMWQAQIRVGRTFMCGNLFGNVEDAARQYDMMAYVRDGPAAELNFGLSAAQRAELDSTTLEQLAESFRLLSSATLPRTRSAPGSGTASTGICRGVSRSRRLAAWPPTGYRVAAAAAAAAAGMPVDPDAAAGAAAAAAAGVGGGPSISSISGVVAAIGGEALSGASAAAADAADSDPDQDLDPDQDPEADAAVGGGAAGSSVPDGMWADRRVGGWVGAQAA